MFLIKSICSCIAAIAKVLIKFLFYFRSIALGSYIFSLLMKIECLNLKKNSFISSLAKLNFRFQKYYKMYTFSEKQNELFLRIKELLLLLKFLNMEIL